MQQTNRDDRSKLILQEASGGVLPRRRDHDVATLVQQIRMPRRYVDIVLPNRIDTGFIDRLYSLLHLVPTIIGWFGIVVASIPCGFGMGITLVKPNFKVLWNFGGMLILLFEILGGWLLFSPII